MRNPIPTPYVVKLLNRFAGIPQAPVPRGEPAKASRPPPEEKGWKFKWKQLLLFVGHLGAVGSAAALALAGVLALATVVATLATALTLTRVLTFTGMLFLDLGVALLILVLRGREGGLGRGEHIGSHHGRAGACKQAGKRRTGDESLGGLCHG